jgi:hypothetical protein
MACMPLNTLIWYIVCISPWGSKCYIYTHRHACAMSSLAYKMKHWGHSVCVSSACIFSSQLVFAWTFVPCSRCVFLCMPVFINYSWFLGTKTGTVWAQHCNSNVVVPCVLAQHKPWGIHNYVLWRCSYLSPFVYQQCNCPLWPCPIHHCCRKRDGLISRETHDGTISH